MSDRADFLRTGIEQFEARRLIVFQWFGLLLMASVIFCATGRAAVLKSTVLVDHARIRLSDLFSGLAPEQDAEIGDAPALGEHYAVGGAQLTAIAAQFGVDWPEASPLAISNVTREARWVGEDDVLPVVRQALDLPDDAHVELSLDGFKPVPVPLQYDPSPVLLHIERPGQEGHFTARLHVLDPRKEGRDISFSVAGTISMKMRAVALRHVLRTGQSILPEDVGMKLVPMHDVPDDALTSPEAAVGLLARAPMTVGTVLGASKLIHPQLVHRGSPVVLTYNIPSLHMTVSGTVLEPGGKGDIVHVYNAVSQMILTGHVLGRAEIEVIPGITPLAAGQHNRRPEANLPSL